MKMSGTWMGIILIACGVLVLAIPELLRWLVGIPFVVIGILALIRR